MRQHLANVHTVTGPAGILYRMTKIIITALPVGRLAREMTPVSLLKHPAIFARLSLMNNCKKFKTGSGT